VPAHRARCRLRQLDLGDRRRLGPCVGCGERLLAEVERLQPAPPLERGGDEGAQRLHRPARVVLGREVPGWLDVDGQVGARGRRLRGPEVDERAAREPNAQSLERGFEEAFDRGLVVGRECLRGIPAAGAGRTPGRDRACQRAGGGDPEQSSFARGEPQLTISTGVPSGSTFESFVISSLSMRMQPWVTLFPNTEVSLLPCTPTSASPPLYSLRTSECADRPYANGPYTVLGSGAWMSTRV